MIHHVKDTESKQRDEMAQKVKFNEFVETNYDEIEKLLEDSKSKNTQISTKGALKKFNSYLKLHQMGHESEILDADLPQVLTKFYTDVRPTKTGECFMTGILKVIRAGLNRHFKLTRGIDIGSDAAFMRANLSLMVSKYKQRKKAKALYDQPHTSAWMTFAPSHLPCSHSHTHLAHLG